MLTVYKNKSDRYSENFIKVKHRETLESITPQQFGVKNMSKKTNQLHLCI